MNKTKQQTWDVLSEPLPVIDEDGIKRWYNKDGNLHRDNDKPAVIHEDGYKEWFINGRYQKCKQAPEILRNPT